MTLKKIQKCRRKKIHTQRELETSHNKINFIHFFHFKTSRLKKEEEKNLRFLAAGDRTPRPPLADCPAKKFF